MTKTALPDLFEAVLAGNLAETTRAIKSGTNINKSMGDGFTALMLAAGKGNGSIVEALIQRGADLNSRNEIGQSALMISAKDGHKGVVAQLIAAGADLRALDNEKRNAISWAVN